MNTPVVENIVGDVATTSTDSSKPRSYRDALIYGKPALTPSRVKTTTPINPENIMEQKEKISRVLVTCRTFSDLSDCSDCLTTTTDDSRLSFGDEHKANNTYDRLMGNTDITVDGPSPPAQPTEQETQAEAPRAMSPVIQAREPTPEPAELQDERPAFTRDAWEDRKTKRGPTKPHKRGKNVEKARERMRQHVEERRKAVEQTPAVSIIQFPTSLQHLDAIPVAKAGEMMAQLSDHITRMNKAEAEMARATAEKCRREMAILRSTLAAVEPMAPELYSTVMPDMVHQQFEPTNAELRVAGVKQILNYRQPRMEAHSRPMPPNFPPPPLRSRSPPPVRRNRSPQPTRRSRSPPPARRSRSPPRYRGDRTFNGNPNYKGNNYNPNYRRDYIPRHSLTRPDLGDEQPMGYPPTLNKDATAEQRQVLEQAARNGLSDQQRYTLTRSLNDVIKLTRCNEKRLELCNRSDWQSRWAYCIFQSPGCPVYHCI